jgi:hypothetical protein
MATSSLHDATVSGLDSRLPVVSIGYRTYKTLGLSLVVWDGDVTGDEAEDHVRRLRADAGWPPGPLHLVDTTTVTSAPNVANTKLTEMSVEIAEGRSIRFALIAVSGAFEEATKFQAAATAAGVSEVIVFNGHRGVSLARRRPRSHSSNARGSTQTVAYLGAGKGTLRRRLTRASLLNSCPHAPMRGVRAGASPRT